MQVEKENNKPLDEGLIKKRKRFSGSIAGKIFGKLKVVKIQGLDNTKKNTTWLCQCECGNFIIISRPNLTRKGIHSCGCFTSQTMKDTFCTHGMTDSNSYRAWTDMKTRCLNIKSHAYKNYGGRGIKICDRWINSFENFLEDMGNPEKGLTLERIDNEKGYSKENCKWIPKKEQNKNKRTNIYIYYNNEKITAIDFWRINGKKHSYEKVCKYAKKGETWKLYT